MFIPLRDGLCLHVTEEGMPPEEESDALLIVNGQGRFHVACVLGGCWLEDQDVGLLFGPGTVLNPPRYQVHLTGTDADLPVAEPKVEPPSKHQEELVLRLVAMPDELTLDLGELYVLPVQFGDDPG